MNYVEFRRIAASGDGIGDSCFDCCVWILFEKRWTVWKLCGSLFVLWMVFYDGNDHGCTMMPRIGVRNGMKLRFFPLTNEISIKNPFTLCSHWCLRKKKPILFHSLILKILIFLVSLAMMTIPGLEVTNFSKRDLRKSQFSL